MSDAIPLPPRAHAERYRKLAKSLRSTTDFSAWARAWIEELAQLKALAHANVEEHVRKLERAWSSFHDGPTPRLADAQLFLARAHGFPSWPRFIDHVAHLSDADSAVRRFEAAADAVVAGDDATLRRMLQADPDLARARSTRDHRSTLLHYIAANGFEDWRQRTPSNAVEIARLLLDAGADVNAVSDAYGGRSTPLSLTATSVHPEKAGMQLDLLDLFLSRGATLHQDDVRSCLANGRLRAARALAERGAPLDLESAAGVGRVDVVRSLFDSASDAQRAAALAWATQYGQREVFAELIERGVPAGAPVGDEGPTALHWAAYGGHADLARTLLARGASATARETRYGGTPLGWALYAWEGERHRTPNYYEVVALLVRAGATLEPDGCADDVDRARMIARLQEDATMMAALRGESA